MVDHGSRQLLQAALRRQAPVQPVLDLGSSPNTTMTHLAHERLLEYFDFPLTPARWMSFMFQAVCVDERVLERLHIDTRAVVPDPTKTAAFSVLPDGRVRDSWGIMHRPTSMEGRTIYYQIEASPLSNATSSSDIDRHSWPTGEDISPDDAMVERARQLHRETSFAVVGHPGDTSLFETAWGLLGFEHFLVSLVRNGALIHAVMERVLEVQLERMKRFLSDVGDYLDVICVGDDLGHQGGLLISPLMYRKLIKPYHRRFFAYIKANTRARLKLHSCGGIHPLLEDFIELGVDAINPVQITAKGMLPQGLAKQFGERMAFWGGMDTQGLLRTGTVGQIRQAVRKTVCSLGAHHGYVLGAVHNIQPDVPPENIVAMYDEAWCCRRHACSPSSRAG